MSKLSGQALAAQPRMLTSTRVQGRREDSFNITISVLSAALGSDDTDVYLQLRRGARLDAAEHPDEHRERISDRNVDRALRGAQCEVAYFGLGVPLVPSSIYDDVNVYVLRCVAFSWE
jgi:hypothetical protein